MNLRKRIVYGLEALGVIAVVGTLGYVLIEDVAVFDAVYMVVITITTVGFREAFELGDAGRILTMFILLSGFGVAIFTAAASIEYLVDIGELRKGAKMAKKAEQMKGHTIVCGWGRVGKATWGELVSRHVETVVVEQGGEQADDAIAMGAVVIKGDATHNGTLELAGVHEATSLIACVADDSDNLVIVLSAKALAPELRVISRASEPESEGKLRLAGAEAVVAPQSVGAERLAAMASQPDLSQIFDLVVDGSAVEFHVREINVSSGCAIEGKTIASSGIRQRSGALVIALEQNGKSTTVNPGPGITLVTGDRLVVVGTRQQVEAALAVAAPLG